MPGTPQSRWGIPSSRSSRCVDNDNAGYGLNAGCRLYDSVAGTQRAFDGRFLNGWMRERPLDYGGDGKKLQLDEGRRSSMSHDSQNTI
ncbi:hypothetical protein K443DRAFT_680787 [Laccaria amethystina LaAM-08-1]|uniref:Uncharacterized protein n=1 Tax=Laccaria amethystina LaAM-08-1 TaxID=1095629 RepID=A0A0C9WMS1_9AGAR|nr:hypothetical protein K443DRAFT_680787 [Laccaria amethystina LaAM-08-1]